MKIVPENVGDSMRISIGPIVSWLGVLTGLLLIMILGGAGLIPAWDGLKHAINTGKSLGGYVLGIAACAGLILFLLYGLLLNLFGSETVTVSPTELQIQWLISGLVRSQRDFPNSTIEKLRYESWPGPRGAGMQSGIRFDCVGETVTFAQNLSEQESYDLIEKMRQIYAFPVSESPDEEEESSPAVTHW